MYKQNQYIKTSLQINESYTGETIEQKINRIVNNKEPISDGAPLIYTERKDGVQPEYDIRTDRFEIAIEKMDYVTKSHAAKRQERIDDSNAKKEGFKDAKDKATKMAEAAKNTKTEGNQQSTVDNQ